MEAQNPAPKLASTTAACATPARTQLSRRSVAVAAFRDVIITGKPTVT